MLAASLIHGLCERSIFSVDDAFQIVERAIDIQQDVADTPMGRSHAPLSAIAESLKADSELNRGDAAPRP